VCKITLLSASFTIPFYYATHVDSPSQASGAAARNSGERIFLWGMMGAGKSTLGHALAQRLGWPWVDLDESVATLTGMTIPEYFQQFGEAAFRRVEAQALDLIIQIHSKVIVATGGGAPTFGYNLEAMRLAGVTVYLDVTPMELARRLNLKSGNRPLIAGVSPGALPHHLSHLLAAREYHYQQAHIHLKGDNITLEQLWSALRSSKLLTLPHLPPRGELPLS